MLNSVKIFYLETNFGTRSEERAERIIKKCIYNILFGLKVSQFALIHPVHENRVSHS